MDRKDFRPESDRESSRTISKPVSNRDKVISNFIDGKGGRTGNDSLYTDGKVLKSYNTVIAVRQQDGNVVVNNTKYSSTTSIQQSKLESQLKSKGVKYDVTGGKDYGYEGEDFSNTDRLRKYNYDVNNPEYKKEIADEKSGAEHYEKLAKENPEHAKTLHRMAQNEREHEKKLKEIEKEDYVDRLMRYEDGKMSRAEENKFLEETEKKGLTNKLQGHYGRETAYRKRTGELKEHPHTTKESKPDTSKRYTLSEMKEGNKRAGQYFFSRDTMKFYKGAKYKTSYNPRTDTNFVIVEKTEFRGGKAYYKYNKSNGHLEYLTKEDYQKLNP